MYKLTSAVLAAYSEGRYNMQLDIFVKAEEIRLPISTSSTIQGVIYNALKKDNNYSTYLHDHGNNLNGRKYKFFTFSDIRGNYRIENKEIVFLECANFSVRSTDAYLIQLLFSHFTEHPEIEIGSSKAKIEKLRLRDEQIFSDEIRIQTLSPITVYITESDGHTLYYSPADKEFYNAIITNARRKWITRFGSDSDFELEINPVENCSYRRRITRFKETIITAWHGEFILKGPPIVLNFLYNIGLGVKNSQGFGMFEVKK